MTLGFARQPLTRIVARGMRAATRGKELDGHKFSFGDLQELWISDDEHHVVATHTKDPGWQYWQDTPDGGGWQLASVHHSLRAACSAACDHEYGEVLPESGRYVVACAGEGHKVIRVRVTSTEGPELIRGIFTRLGYEVGMEEVGDPVPIARTG
jgi:hypothetical protein